MANLITPENLNKPIPQPVTVPGTLRGPKSPNYAKDIARKYNLPGSLPKPAKVVDQPKV
jgi:hypothetical protein